MLTLSAYSLVLCTYNLIILSKILYSLNILIIIVILVMLNDNESHL